MNKKTLTLSLLLSFTLLFTACGGSSETDDVNTNGDADTFYYSYSTPEFDIEIPDNWETVNAFTSEYPEEIRVAFRNNIKDSGFTANVTIHREENRNNLSNIDFAQDKINDHAGSLINYKLKEQEEVTLSVSNGESTTILNLFEGKNEIDSQDLKFMQTYLIKGETAWTVTATYRDNEDEFVIERMNHMLKSFLLN
jgi:hypothetical protein